jgi:hypothetical protein
MFLVLLELEERLLLGRYNHRFLHLTGPGGALP